MMDKESERVSHSEGKEERVGQGQRQEKRKREKGRDYTESSGNQFNLLLRFSMSFAA